MITSIILVISLFALLQFFISYSRSLIAAYGTQPLSAQVREVASIRGRTINGEEFPRLVQLARLCPESRDDRWQVFAVNSYFGFLNFVRDASRRLLPSVSEWSDRERAGCAYFAAITLDRRIASSRRLMAQQLSNQH
ncbi:MAG TPA: hypothetical protein VLV89_05105 [Candidatus Acidoferrum sp.]|nr:hypothetical protein [Candidatus Acidoferrum sp.]